MNNFSITKESMEFLKNRFSAYYKNFNIDLPDRFGKREFAFVMFGGKGMLRHLSFDRKYSFKKFINSYTSHE